ncbi:hypothetical protein [Rhizobacter sp. Root1221]|jgi:hypothetical protein|nr:hypothetical protein [Rhizobacter sp. Root1221]
MSRRHDPAPPGKPEPGELPVEPDQGAFPPPGSSEEEDEADLPAPT